MLLLTFPKRKWMYVQNPPDYGIAPCICGNHETVYSEWHDHIWCPKCQIDFVPLHWGIFDGPIPVNVAQMLGMCFDRYYLETHTIEKFNKDDF
jgi:hypothetical protein